MADLSLWLDDYHDLYSDFDSRHYLKRRISEDFIDELKSALTYRKESPEALVLLLPAPARNPEAESLIPQSVKEQFRGRLDILGQKASNAMKHGIQLLLAGIAIMIIDSIIFYKSEPTYLAGLASIIMEPAGWFMIWNGLEFLIYKYRSIKKEMSFYETVVRLSIRFEDA
jgi:hypothetical protein